MDPEVLVGDDALWATVMHLNERLAALRAENSLARTTIDAQSKAILQLTTENERLVEECRLSGELLDRQGQLADQQEAELRAEIARLRALLHDMRESSGAILNEHWQERLDELFGRSNGAYV